MNEDVKTIAAVEVLTAAADVSTLPEDSNTPESADSQRVVRMLSVGQAVKGVVKRVSEFGAFVDIGVGRDGLVHISELSVRRVGKVTDVLQQGLEATFWIKKLDRDRNRISLTMIEPGTKTIRDMEKDDIVQGTVTRIMPYGAFVDIGIGRDALLHVREMGERFVAKPEDVVKVGDVIDARIIEISRRRARVDLSIKGLRPEPELETPPEPEVTSAPEEPAQKEPEQVDTFANVEVLNPFEAALKRAMAGGVKLNLRKDDRKVKKNDSFRARQEEALARTLNTSGKK
jgi:small subunit ribosomal protein S1